MKKFFYTICALMFAVAISKAQTNYLDSYIGNPVTLTTIGTSTNQLNQPRDLDFKPNSNELWVCQYGNTAGGTMDIFFNAGLPNQTNQLRHDSHADHFFFYPSAIAFSENGEFGAVSEIQNTNTSSPTFMGPSLWLSDTSIFARVWQGAWSTNYPLGSHIDMLHQSPFSMGIAHDTLLAYWVMDGYNGNICKYDFVNDHGPGYDNHSAGKIYRYSDVTVSRVPQVPSHLVLDKPNHWLYFIDGGSKKIKRMNINSGTFSGNLTAPTSGSEPLAGYYNYLGATVETLDSLSTQPCGIDYYNGRLIVSDYTTGDIYLYNTTGVVSILDTIVTGHPGIMGVKVGPDGHIWCVNKTENKIYRLDAALPMLDASITGITSPLVEDDLASYYSTGFDVCDGNITPTITIANNGSSTITTLDLQYTVDGGNFPVSYTWNGTLTTNSTASVVLPSAPVGNGSHRLSVSIITVNNVTDDVDLNNTMKGSFRTFSPAQNLPFTEDFSAIVFPPANWNYVHFNKNNFMSHSAASSFGIGIGSMQMNNYSGPMIIIGQKDYLMSPRLNFSTALSNTYLRFDVAYAQYTGTDNDELKIVASADCGVTWTQVYDKAGTTLMTAPVTTAAFTPTSSQWRTDSVSLGSYAGQSEVMLMFTTISDYGNNLYLDNINVGSISVGIAETNTTPYFNVFPNPANDFLTVHLTTPLNTVVSVSDILGQEVISQKISGTQNNFQLNTSELNTGIYFITLQSGKITSTQKIIINKN